MVCDIIQTVVLGMYEVKSKSSVGSGDEAEGFRHQGNNNGRCSTGRWYPESVLC